MKVEKAPRIAIAMGSDSDLKIMQACIDLLQEWKIAYEIRILSAHRTPKAMIEFSENAQTRGLKVIIAAAGGAAHLPGMIASCTHLPVIGVPVSLANLNGIDSLLSIVQMPFGVPVASMAIDGARNAALFAIKILSLEDKKLALQLARFTTEQELKVKAMDKKIKK